MSLSTGACLSICGFQRQLLSEPRSEPCPSVPSTQTCPTLVILSRVTVTVAARRETPGDILPRLRWLSFEQDAILTGLTEQKALGALIGLITDQRERVIFRPLGLLRPVEVLTRTPMGIAVAWPEPWGLSELKALTWEAGCHCGAPLRLDLALWQPSLL